MRDEIDKLFDRLFVAACVMFALLFGGIFVAVQMNNPLLGLILAILGGIIVSVAVAFIPRQDSYR